MDPLNSLTGPTTNETVGLHVHRVIHPHLPGAPELVLLRRSPPRPALPPTTDANALVIILHQWLNAVID
ncbi:hypothetical protein [Subtercola sp. YIM 133946]|uniref:hypothetical protein n=1 Tax=Subtercola sp. YIM 133946 TaxID=3118909 RepID=UPI002F92D133